jgi:serine/threonine-protein phosphatase 2A regulatory subunit B'
MMKQIFGRHKASKSADKEVIGERILSVLDQSSGSGAAVSNSQPPTLSSTGLGYGRGNHVVFPNRQMNDTLFSSNFQPLPSFKDVLSTERQNLLIQKLNLCCTVFDFTVPTMNAKEKEIKTETLLEIAEYVASANGNGKILRLLWMQSRKWFWQTYSGH